MFDDENDTAMSAAAKRAGLRDETPQEAAERIWKGSRFTRKRAGMRGGTFHHDPVETMRLFSAWALEDPQRMLAVVTPAVWNNIVRAFLERQSPKPGASAIGRAFVQAMRKLELAQHAEAASLIRARGRRDKWNSSDEVRSRTYGRARTAEYEDRKARGVKAVRAEVDVRTGAVVNLIDKEYGPFAHIRISGLPLAQATTEAALKWCDRQNTDTMFVRALCQQIPDPRKPIGEQWTVDMIIEARRVAQRAA